MTLYGDGWYTYPGDAQDCLDLCVKEGALPVGIIESKFGTWGILYWSDRELFSNHRIDSRSALLAVVRKSAPEALIATRMKEQE